MSREWRGGTRGGRFGNAFFAFLACHRIGRVVAPVFVAVVAAYFIVAAPHERRASCAFADRIGRGGSRSRRLLFAWRQFRTNGTMLFEKLAVFGGAADAVAIESVGREHLMAAIASGRGAVCLTAHQGGWEIMGQFLARRGGRATLVMHDGMPPGARAALERFAAAREFSVLFSDGGPATAAAVVAAIRRGDLVGMMGDRVQGGRGVATSFLGGEVEFAPGPFAIAAAADVPLLLVFCERTGSRRYRFECVPEDAGPAPPDETRTEAVHRRAAFFARRLESVVLRSPEQWGNFFDFWREIGAR